jgi:dynein heavy chain
LTLVVKMERPDLAAKKEELIAQQNQFKITLKRLEDGLLQQLAEATGDILENIELIESLERSKALSTEINIKVEIAKVTEVAINEASEAYRPAASRGALVFFLMNPLLLQVLARLLHHRHQESRRYRCREAQSQESAQGDTS